MSYQLNTDYCTENSSVVFFFLWLQLFFNSCIKYLWIKKKEKPLSELEVLDLSLAVEIWPLLASCCSAGDSRGGGAGPWRSSGGWASLLAPAVEVSAASIHEEVADGGELKAQLLWNGHLQLFGRPLILSEDCHQCTSLQVCEDQPSTLWSLVPLLFGLLLLLPLTCWGKETEKPRNRVSLSWLWKSFNLY